MSTALPEYHFRVRKNGAAWANARYLPDTCQANFFRERENGTVVFWIDTENRQYRAKMDQIAAINIRNGEIKPHGQRTLPDRGKAEIEHWMKVQKAYLARRDTDDIHGAVDRPNLTTQ